MLKTLRAWLPEVALPLITAAMLAACGAEDDNESLGAPLTPAGDVRADCELTWSADASEIYYIASPLIGPTSLRAAKSDGSGARVIDDSKSEYWTLIMPPDRSSLYYTAFASGGATRSLYEAFNPREISGLTLDNKADVVAAAPDGRHLAFWSGGTLQYFDTRDASSIALAEGTPKLSGTAGNHEVITFSPSGDALFFLFFDGGQYQGSLVNLATGSIESKTRSDALWPAVSWDEEGIRVLWAVSNAGNTSYRVENVMTGAISSLWQSPYGDISIRNVWSPDGRSVAVWAARCVEAGGSIDSCGKYVGELFVISTQTGTASRIARTIGGTGAMTFSPDGHRIAYVTHQRVYVSNVP